MDEQVAQYCSFLALRAGFDVCVDANPAVVTPAAWSASPVSLHLGESQCRGQAAPVSGLSSGQPELIDWIITSSHAAPVPHFSPLFPWA